jgi:excisionase family DNA binding protein
MTGLEDFFSSDDKAGQGVLTLEEASKRLNLSERTIQRRLKEGRLKGFKISGPRGPEWRIAISDTEGETVEALVASDDTTTSSDDRTFIHDVSSEDKTRDTEDATTSAMERLLRFYEGRIEKLEGKLESVVWRNGYLEAQLEEAESQVKLLPDYEAQAARAAELEAQLTEAESKAVTADSLGQQVIKLETELSSLRQNWFKRFGNWLAGKEVH